MAPTATEIKEASDWLRGQEFSVELIFKPAPKAQWFRADGTPLPNLLPVDYYHLMLYRRKGWTLRGSEVVLPEVAIEIPEVASEGPLQTPWAALSPEAKLVKQRERMAMAREARAKRLQEKRGGKDG